MICQSISSRVKAGNLYWLIKDNHTGGAEIPQAGCTEGDEACYPGFSTDVGLKAKQDASLTS
jgi:hypothetical protein